MSSQNYTWMEVTKKIKSDLDIAIMLDNIFEKKLWHPNAPINKHLKNGELEFQMSVKSNYTMITCPLHDSKIDDSTYYYHDKNEFVCKVGHCRSKGVTLNPIDLYSVITKNVDPNLIIENTDEFKESARELADMLGFTWSYDNRILTDDEKKEINKQRIRQEVSEIYHKSLMKKNQWSQRARDFFLIERGFGQLGQIAEDMIVNMKLGHASGKYGTKFIYNILKKKYTDEELLYSGVVQYKKVYDEETEKSIVTDEIIDFLTNRFTIPYHKGKKIDHAYGRRIEFKAELEKQYAGLSEEAIAKKKKGKHLRFKGGVDEPINFQEAKKYESIIIVEGEMDWLTFMALGFKNVVAVGGTNGINHKDIQLLKHNRIKSNGDSCNKILLCFDEDEAGQVAMGKIAPMFLAEGFDVRVMRINEGDPNDYLKKYGKGAKDILANIMEEAISYDAFAAIHKLKKAKMNNLPARKAALQSVREHLITIHKDELLFVAMEIAEILNHNVPENKQIPLNWLLHAWDLVPNTASLEPIGFDKAIGKPWIVITDDLERHEALESIGFLDNAVYIPDMETFLSKLKKSEGIKNITFDFKMNIENRNKLLTSLQGFKIQAFVSETVDDIKKLKNMYQFIEIVRKVDIPNRQIS